MAQTPREAGEAAFYECEGNNAAALKAAFDAYEAARGWQPIETAPKDWTDVLLFDPEYENDHRKVFEGYYSPRDGGFGFWVDAAYTDCVNPTHWQPLATPPNHSKAKEG